MDLPPAHFVRDEMQNRRLIVNGLNLTQYIGVSTCNMMTSIFFLFLIAMWAALAEVLPDVEIHGCHFHHRQRIMKRVKEVEGNLIIDKKEKN